MFTHDELTRFQSLETPFYYYDLHLLRHTLAVVKQHAIDKGMHVHYALKANFNDGVLAVIKAHGLGIDAVSGNEVAKALEAGFTPGQIVFAGVGKSDKEINFALDNDIFCFNCESGQEITVINELASKKGKTAKIALRINPNVDPKTHKFITTGLTENKFGINPWELEGVLQIIKGCGNISLTGIHFHIGSQVTDISRYRLLCDKVNEIRQWFDDQGVDLKIINVGGGLGIDYHAPDANPIPPLKEYFEIFEKNLPLRPHQELHFELGRAIVGQCGSLISRVLYTKPSETTTFAIIDAGMTELMRPALYQAYHHIDNLTGEGEETTYDVVGPICESSDSFAKGILLKPLQRGDMVALRSAGAYGEVMASRYNLRDDIRTYFSE